jgi:4-amino-4-deoxy-L-arabinose transferase-like glycosyltransferase
MLAALLAVRLLALRFNATELFFDEAQYWTWSLEPAFGYYSKPPLVAWLIRLATEACGVSEFCIRLPAPILHTLTPAAIYLLGRRLYDRRTGFWAALAFATLPGISVSAGIISTDVPLLLFWALALLALAALLDSESRWPALLLGAALGLGLNAKYAMAYFVICLAVHLAATPEHRRLLRDRRLWAGLALGAALILPNLAWNAANSFATFAHTADNAKWGGALFHPGKALEFLAAQFGVFGPILFGALIVIVARAYRSGLPGPDRLLLAFALPVIVIVTVQAFLSRAHANWAAVSYVAASLLVTATMIRDLSWRWLGASLALHAALLGVVALATAGAGSFALPRFGDPFARTLGWRAVAGAVGAELARGRAAGAPYGAVVTDERALTAELLYYMRGEPTPVLAWWVEGRPQDHYELTRPFRKGSPEPVLLAALRDEGAAVRRHFAKAEPVATLELPAGAHAKRRLVLVRLSGYRGP